MKLPNTLPNRQILSSPGSDVDYQTTYHSLWIFNKPTRTIVDLYPHICSTYFSSRVKWSNTYHANNLNRPWNSLQLDVDKDPVLIRYVSVKILCRELNFVTKVSIYQCHSLSTHTEFHCQHKSDLKHSCTLTTYMYGKLFYYFELETNIRVLLRLFHFGFKAVYLVNECYSMRYCNGC